MCTHFLLQRRFPNTHLRHKVTWQKINKSLLKNVIAKLQTQNTRCDFAFLLLLLCTFCPNSRPGTPSPQLPPSSSSVPDNSLLIMLTSLAPSPMARVTAFLCFLMSSTTCAFCSGVTLQQITALHAHAVDTNSLSMSASRACAWNSRGSEG